MSEALYDVGVRVSMDVSRFSAPAQAAFGIFKDLESAATRADASLARFEPRLQSYFSNLAKAAGPVQQAYAKAEQSMNAILGGGALMPEQRAANLAAHTANMDALTAAQGRLAAQQSKYNALLDAQAVAAGKATTAHAALADAQRQMTGVMGGAALTGFGLGLDSFLKGAAQSAMDLQTIMTGVQVATQATPAQMQGLQDLAASIGLHRQMSVTDVMGVMKEATGAGITNVAQLRSMTDPLAALGEVLKMSKGMPVGQSAAIGTEFAHLFGAYQPDLMKPLVNSLGRALFISPSSPDELLNLVSQFAGTLRPLYGSSTQQRLKFEQDAILTAALESQLGQTTRGGTQLASMITRTFGSQSSRGALQNKALAQIGDLTGGMSFFDNKGQFAGVANAVAILAKVEAAKGETPEAAGQLFKNLFGQVGARQAGLLGDPTTAQRLKALGKELGPHGIPSLDEIQRIYNATPQGQFNQAQKNWESFKTLLGVQLLPALTEVAKELATITGAAVRFGQANPEVLKFAAGFAAMSAAAATIGGPIMLLANAMPLLGASTEGFAAALGPAAGMLGLMGAGIAAEVLLFEHWNDVMRVTSGRMEGMNSKAALLASGLASLFAPLIAGVDALNMLGDVLGLLGGGGVGGKGQPSGPPLHRGDVWDAKTGVWMRHATRNGVAGYVPDVQGLSQQQIKQLHVHANAFTTHITIQGHADEKTVKKAVTEANKKTLTDLAQAFGIDANYGGYAFTSNPTLRSAGV